MRRRCSTTGWSSHAQTGVHGGRLQNLITPRYWAAKMGLPAPVPCVNNLVVEGSGPPLNGMIAETDRALLVTCFYVHPHGRSADGARDRPDA